MRSVVDLRRRAGLVTSVPARDTGSATGWGNRWGNGSSLYARSMTRKQTVRQTRDDLVRHLHDEIDLLRTSGAAFDDGSIVQAKILAVRIRVLVHDTDRSKSLLRQLRVKDGLRFIDTSQTPPPPGAVMIDAGLASIRIGFGDGASTEYAAPLGSRDRRPPLPFRPLVERDGPRRRRGESVQPARSRARSCSY